MRIYLITLAPSQSSSSFRLLLLVLLAGEASGIALRLELAGEAGTAAFLGGISSYLSNGGESNVGILDVRLHLYAKEV